MSQPLASDQPDSKRIRRHFCLVIAVAILARAIYFIQYLRSPVAGFHKADHQYYIEWAIRIASGDWLGSRVFEQGPLYPYLLGIGFKLFGSQESLMLAIQLMSGVLTASFVYACGRRLWGPTTGLLAGFIAALYGPLIYAECMLMKSFLSPLFTVATLYFGLRFQDDQRTRWLAMASVCVGLACLIRENHILMMVPLLMLTWFESRVHDNETDKSPRTDYSKAAKRFGWSIAACGLMLTPSLLRNLYVTGEFIVVTSGGGEVFYMAYEPDADGYYGNPDFVRPSPFYEHEDFRAEASRRVGHELSQGESSRYWFGKAWEHAIRSPGRTIGLMFRKAAILANDFEVPDSFDFRVVREFIPILYALPTMGWITGFGLLGYLVSIGDRRRLLLPIGLAAAHIVFVILVYNFARFRLGLIPIWILFAAFGINWLISTARSRVTGWSIKTSGAVLLVAFMSVCAFLPPIGYAKTALPLREKENRQQLLDRRELMKNIDELRLSVLQDADDAKLQRQLAFHLMEFGAFNEATKLYDRSIEIAPDDSRTRLLYGIDLHRALNKTEAAIAQLKQAATLDPELDEARYELIEIFMKGKQYNEALEQYQRLSKRHPNDSRLHFNVANLLQATGKFTQAINELQSAITDLQPKNRAQQQILFDSYQLSIMILRSKSEQLTKVDDRNLAALLRQIADRYQQIGLAAESMQIKTLARDIQNRL